MDVTVEVYKHNEAQRGKDFPEFVQLVCGRHLPIPNQV